MRALVNSSIYSDHKSFCNLVPSSRPRTPERPGPAPLQGSPRGLTPIQEQHDQLFPPEGAHIIRVNSPVVRSPTVLPNSPMDRMNMPVPDVAPPPDNHYNEPEGQSMNMPVPDAVPSMPVPEPAPAMDESVNNHNPLPRPPEPVEIPDHLISGTAVTQQSVRRNIPPEVDRRPLSNPLPEPPLDVYNTPKYRDLTRGVGGSIDIGVQVYPDGWFDGERHQDGHVHHQDHHHHEHHVHRPHQITRTYTRSRSHTQDTSTSSGEKGRSFLSRLFSGRKKRDPIPNFSARDMPAQGKGSAWYTSRAMSAAPVQRSRSVQGPPMYSAPLLMPVQFAPMPLQQQQQQQQSQHFRSQSAPGYPMAMPMPMNMPMNMPPYHSPPAPIKFNKSTSPYSAFCHTSLHSILYKKKLYPSALHLFEAWKFLGKRSDLAERVRTTERTEDVLALTGRLRVHVRKDWEKILREKVCSSFLTHRHLFYSDMYLLRRWMKSCTSNSDNTANFVNYS